MTYFPPALADDFRFATKAKIAQARFNTAAHILARKAGFPDRAVEMLEKAALGAVASGSSPGDAMVTLAHGSKAWFQTLRTASIFARLLDSGMMKMPLNQAFGIATSAPVAHVVGEGRPAPLTLYGADIEALTPVSVLAMLAITDEVVAGSDAGTLEAVDSELRGACAAAVDAKFWTLAGAGVSGFSLGASGGSFRADCEELLTAVNTTGAGSLVWACSPDVAIKASFYDENMSPVGGEILGLPAMVSTSIPSGTLRLANAVGFAGDLVDIDIGSSRNASLEMKDASLAQDATTGTGTTLVSTFQSGMSAVRAIVTFGCAKVRSNAAHEIDSVTWSS